MKQFLRILGSLLGIHVLGLLFLSFYRCIEFFVLRGMITDQTTAVTPAFIRGLWFDNVMGCYVMIIPLALVLLAASFGYCRRWMLRTVAVWFCVLYALLMMASAANIPYFAYFFKNINSSIFEWFGYTGTTAGMVFQEKTWWVYIALYFMLTAVFCWLVWKIMERTTLTTTSRKYWLPSLLITVALIALCLFGIRGRTGYNPIKISQAYYCNDPFLNQLGINPAFNLLTSALDDMRKENAELMLMPYDEAITYVRNSLNITGPADSTQILLRQMRNSDREEEKILTVAKPNIVIILMESMSSALLGKGYTPVLDSLKTQSLYFSNFYSAGIHTNHGMTATLYSFPALMKRNLMKGTVTPKRDGLPTVLKQNGWHNLFFMTHEAQYDNMNAFFRTNGYDEIYAQEDYPKEEIVNSFGVSDHFLFDFALGKLNNTAKQQQPFMATLLTISNHPPYIIPDWFKSSSKEPETQIVEYADWCIGDFLKKAKKESWYDNTVFVVLADHGKLVGTADSELPQSYNHIPLMIFGAGIPSQEYTQLGMQVDVMPTLLNMLGLDYDYNGFGMDLLHQQRQMVFYSADNQIVARDSTRCFLYHPQMKKSFCYDIGHNGQLIQTHNEESFASLRRYVFAMEQTAEFLFRKLKIEN